MAASARRPYHSKLDFIRLHFVAEGIIIAAGVAGSFASLLAISHQVIQTAQGFYSGLTADGTAFVALHAQLVFSLTRDREVGELIRDGICRRRFSEEVAGVVTRFSSRREFVAAVKDLSELSPVSHW